MASLDSLNVRKALQTYKVVQRADDASIAIRVRYIGAAGTPSIVVTTATKIAMTDATATVDYAWTTYTNMGLLADALNASGLWEAKILDALRSDVTLNSFKSNTTVTPGTDENGVVVWDLVHDNNIESASNFFATVTLSPYLNFDAPDGHRVHIQELDYCQNVSAAEAGAVRVYKRKDAKTNGDEVLIWSNVSVDSTGGTTVTSHTFASGNGMISGGDNEELIFRVQDATSITDADGNLVRIVGILE
jgi:hypothetical protein